MPINKTGMRAAWIIILCAAISVIAGSVLGRYAVIYGADTYAARIMCQMLMLIPALAGNALIYAARRKGHCAVDMGYRRFHPGSVFFLLILPSCSRYFGIYIQSFGGAFTEQSFAVDRSFIPENIYEMLMLFLSNCLIAPIFEEMLFRGAVYKCAEPYGSVRAVVVAALGFALVHFNSSAFVYLFFWGLVLGAVRVWSGSVVACMLFHSILNFETFLHSVYVNELYYVTDFLQCYATVMTYLFPVALIGMYLCFGRGKGRKKVQCSGVAGIIPMLCVLVLYFGVAYTKGF